MFSKLNKIQIAAGTSFLLMKLASIGALISTFGGLANKSYLVDAWKFIIAALIFFVITLFLSAEAYLKDRCFVNDADKTIDIMLSDPEIVLKLKRKMTNRMKDG